MLCILIWWRRKSGWKYMRYVTHLWSEDRMARYKLNMIFSLTFLCYPICDSYQDRI